MKMLDMAPMIAAMVFALIISVPFWAALGFFLLNR